MKAHQHISTSAHQHISTSVKLVLFLIVMLAFSYNITAQNPNSNAGGTNWKLSGNQVTSSDFVGTTNTTPLRLKCNNITALEISADTSARFMGNMIIDKLKPVIPLPPNEVRIVTADNNGKLTSLDRSGLVGSIYDPQIQCPIDLNGLFIPVWSAKGLTPTLGALYTGVNCPAWVGIGTDNPTANLDVRGKGLFTSNLQVLQNASKMVIGAASSQDLGHGTSYLGFNAQRIGSATGIWQTSSDGPHNGGAVIYGDIFGSLRFVTLPYTNTPNQGQNLIPDATVAQNTRLFIHKDGNVGIGTDNPRVNLEIKDKLPSILLSDDEIETGTDATADFTLHSRNGAGRLISTSKIGIFIDADNNETDAFFEIVANSDAYTSTAKPLFKVKEDGNVFCSEMTVQPAPFPDYVFKSDYNLMSLKDLENFIHTNRHLPNIPTAKEIEKNGLPLGEIVVKQMEKIEELTLYIIALEKRMVEIESKK